MANKLRILTSALWLLSCVGWAASSINGNDGVSVVNQPSNVPVSSSSPFPVTCISGCSGGGGGGTQYTEGATTSPATASAVLCRYLAAGNTLTNGQLWSLACDASNYLLVDVKTSALPTGAATSANQTTANTSLTSIATNTGNIPVQGLAAPTGSEPIVEAKTTWGDASTTITTGGTAQTAHAASTSDRYVVVCNLDTTEPLWYNVGAVATTSTGSIGLSTATTTTPSVCNGFSVNNQNISVIAATTGHKFTVKYWQ